MAEAATHVDLAHLIAEAVAGLPGAEQRLAAWLRPGLEALLAQRLAGAEPVSVAETGRLVQRHWQQLVRAGDAVGACAIDAGTGGATGTVSGKESGRGRKGASANKSRKGARTGKGAKGALGTRGAQGESAAQGSGVGAEAPAVDDATTADGVANPLYFAYLEQAAALMQRLVRDAACGEPDGPAQRAMLALEALESLDPPLARVARMRWFAGLDNVAVARVLGEGEPEAQRRWLKAHAYLRAATKDFPAPTP